MMDEFERRDGFQSVRDQAGRLIRNLDLVASPSWYHRPLTVGELAAHPDRERIAATIVTVVNAAAPSPSAAFERIDHGRA